MFKFLFVMFFFFILLLVLMGFSVLRTFKRIFFGIGDDGKKRSANNRTSNQKSHTYTTKQERKSSSRPKIFSKDEGEYVDYEEVK
jgi:hypothetical protein